MKVSEILRQVKPIDEELHDALERALTHPFDAYYNHNYAQFTSLSHAIHSGFRWKDTEEGHEYWQGIVDGIDSAKDGSSEYFDRLSFISELHRKKPNLRKSGGYCAAKIINEVISVNPKIGKRILIEYQRYDPGCLHRMTSYLTLSLIIQSINWANTKEGFLWWERLRESICDKSTGNLISEKLKDYESTT